MNKPVIRKRYTLKSMSESNMKDHLSHILEMLYWTPLEELTTIEYMMLHSFAENPPKRKLKDETVIDTTINITKSKGKTNDPRPG